MRYPCYTCGKCVTTELPDDSVIRAELRCPECIEIAYSGASELLETLKALAEQAARTQPKPMSLQDAVNEAYVAISKAERRGKS